MKKILAVLAVILAFGMIGCCNKYENNANVQSQGYHPEGRMIIRNNTKESITGVRLQGG